MRERCVLMCYSEELQGSAKGRYTYFNATLHLCAQVILSVAEHHSSLVPWQLLAQRLGIVLKFVKLKPDNTELDMKVRRWSQSRLSLPAARHDTSLYSFDSPRHFTLPSVTFHTHLRIQVLIHALHMGTACAKALAQCGHAPSWQAQAGAEYLLSLTLRAIHFHPCRCRCCACMQHFKGLLGPRTKLVSLVHVSNTLGAVLDASYVVEAAKKVRCGRAGDISAQDIQLRLLVS